MKKFGLSLNLLRKRSSGKSCWHKYCKNSEREARDSSPQKNENDQAVLSLMLEHDSVSFHLQMFCPL